MKQPRDPHTFKICGEYLQMWTVILDTSQLILYQILPMGIKTHFKRPFCQQITSSNIHGDQHCKPKPCKTYRELPVSQFSQGKTCFHYREPLISLQGPCFHYRDFPVNPCTSLLGIAVKRQLDGHKGKGKHYCFDNIWILQWGETM